MISDIPARYINTASKIVRKRLAGLHSGQDVAAVWQHILASAHGRRAKPSIGLGDHRNAYLIGRVIAYCASQDRDRYMWHRNTLPIEWHDVCDRLWDAAVDARTLIRDVPLDFLDGFWEVSHA